MLTVFIQVIEILVLFKISFLMILLNIILTVNWKKFVVDTVFCIEIIDIFDAACAVAIGIFFKKRKKYES